VTNLNEIPSWAWGVGLTIALAIWGAFKYLAGGKILGFEKILETFRNLHRGHYEDDRARALEIKDLEIRMLRDELTETRKERDYWRGKCE